MESICKNCKKQFKSNRRDQLYCSAKCKNEYNNKQKSSSYYITQPINDILWRNRNVLKELCRLLHVKKKDLFKAGYDLNYHTHEFSNDLYDRVYFCYDYGIQQINKSTFKIYHREQIQIDKPY